MNEERNNVSFAGVDLVRNGYATVYWSREEADYAATRMNSEEREDVRTRDCPLTYRPEPIANTNDGWVIRCFDQDGLTTGIL